MKRLPAELVPETELRLLRALGNPVRLAVVAALARRGECVCGELLPDLPIAASTLSEHLSALKEAGLVRGEVQGPYRCYCLEPAALDTLARYLGQLAARARGSAPVAAAPYRVVADDCCPRLH